MKLHRLAIPVALLSLVTACGGSTPPTATPTTPVTGSPPTTSASPSAGSDSGNVLTGVVGTEAAPEAFTITLKDAAGADVTTLKAGTYKVMVKDLSPELHNFHLTGTGVDETTPIKGLMDVEWTVTFVAGTYTYLCDPHQNMVKTFTVT